MSRNKVHRKITARDIAREANVSVATISRIINNSGPVSQEKRERVEAIIKKYNYRPNAIARSLLMNNTKTIGFMIPDITNMFFAQLCLEVEKAALKLGYSVFLCNSINDPVMETRYLQIMQEKQVNGVILAGGQINRTQMDPAYVNQMKIMFENMPLVLLNGNIEGMSCIKIRTDEYQAVETMVQYLLSLEHRQIGLVGGLSGVTSFDLKIKAFEKTQEQYSLVCETDWIQKTPYTIDGGICGMDRMIQSGSLPTAIIAINDLVALGVIRSCHKHNIRVPEDISVIGFDDIELARMSSPPLTTMAHPYCDMGFKAVSAIHDLVEDKQPDEDLLLETRLVIRDSCQIRSGLDKLESLRLMQISKSHPIGHN